MRVLGYQAAVILALSATIPGRAVAQEDLLTRGGAALQQGDAASAETAFEAAVAVDATNPAGWIGLSAAHEISGDLAAALAAARQAERLAPGRPEPLFALARLLGRVGRLEEALAAYARLRELAGDLEEVYLLPGVLLRDAGRREEAIALMEGGLDRAGGVVLAQQLAFLTLASGDPERALQVAEAALGEGETNGDLTLAKALALAALPQRRSEAGIWFGRALELGVAQPSRARLEWGRLLSDLGEWSAAVELLRQVTVQMPDEAEGFFRLGTALRQTGDLEGAAAALARYQLLEAADEAAEREVREIGTALNEAQELASENRLDEALARLNAVEDPESDPRLLVLRAKILFSGGRVDEALVAVSRAASMMPLAIEPSYLEALFAFASNRYVQAEAAAERALALDPSLGELWALYGSALARDQRPEEAAVAFERALETGFESAAMRLDYAGVLSDLGRPEESREQLEARERLTGG